MTIKVKTKDDVVNYWMTEVKAGEKYRSKYGLDKRWKDFRDYYRGEWAEGIYPVNRIFSYGRSMVPRIYFRSPRVTVTATHPDLVPHARVVEAIDNWLIHITNLKATLKTGALTTYLCGTGPIKLGYDSEFGYDPTQAVGKDSQTATQEARRENRSIEYNVNIRPGLPWALPVYPEDIVVPWGYRSPSSLPWIGHKILRPLDDIKQDQKYSNTSELTGSRRVNLETTDAKRRSFLSEGKDVLFGELIEIRDAATKEMITICENKILYKSKDALQVNGFNYEFIIFNEDPEYFWGIPDVKILEPQQLELNEIKTQNRRHRKIALIKFLYLRDAIKKTEMEAFLSGEVGPGVAVDGDSIANAIVALQPHIPPDLQSAAIEVLGDMRETIGFSENQVGAFRQGTPGSATETANVEQSFAMRIDEKKDIMADALVNIVRKWHTYIFSYWTGERVTEVVGPDGGQYWVRFTGDELKGEYNLITDPESGFPMTRQMRQQFADGLMAKYGGDQLIDQIALRKFHLSQYEWMHPGLTGLILPAPPEAAQMASGERQPAPAHGPGGVGRAAGTPGGNRGGGQRGFTPGNVIPFENFKKNFGGIQR